MTDKYTASLGRGMIKYRASFYFQEWSCCKLREHIAMRDQLWPECTIKHWPLWQMSLLWVSSVRTPVPWWSDLWDGTLDCGLWRYLEITGRTPGQTSNSSVQTLIRLSRDHGSPGQQRRPPDLVSRSDTSGLSPPAAVLYAERRSVLWPPPGVRDLCGSEDAQLPQNSPHHTLHVLQVYAC